MSALVIDLELLYRQTFGGKLYRINEVGKAAELPPFNINATNNTSTRARVVNLLSRRLISEKKFGCPFVFMV